MQRNFCFVNSFTPFVSLPIWLTFQKLQKCTLKFGHIFSIKQFYTFLKQQAGGHCTELSHRIYFYSYLCFYSASYLLMFTSLINLVSFGFLLMLFYVLLRSFKRDWQYQFDIVSQQAPFTWHQRNWFTVPRFKLLILPY